MLAQRKYACIPLFHLTDLELSESTHFISSYDDLPPVPAAVPLYGSEDVARDRSL